ncbi:HAMP domain-containing protein [Myxococcaceae bacterium JPH2]|nr:HAMP domain-containing protein [Myxococcaceae bacterium JPH2]
MNTLTAATLQPLRGMFARVYAGVFAASLLAFLLMTVSASTRLTSAEPPDAHLAAQSRESAAEVERLTEGLRWLMEEQLRARPEQDRAALLHAWQPHFRYPLSLRSLDEVLALPLPALTREQLSTGRAAAWYRAQGALGDTVEVFQPLRDSRQVLVQTLHIGPPPDKVVLFLMPEIATLLLVLGVAVLALTVPLYRHVRRLASTAADLGAGNLRARAETRLPEPLGHLARTFNGMAERLQRMTEEQQATLQAISHELRTPIARLRFAIELARDTEEPASLHTRLGDMDRDIDELDALVAELLTFTRLHSEAPPLERERMDLTDLVHDVITSLAPLTPHLRIHPAPLGPMSCVGCPRYLRRALSNLVRNAQRHAHKEIRVEWALRDDHCLLHVDDDGPGIPLPDRERVFLPFTRLDDSRQRKTGGHGLGLAIVHRVMQAHQGRAQASRAPLGGARITLSWPRHSVTSADNR